MFRAVQTLCGSGQVYSSDSVSLNATVVSRCDCTDLTTKKVKTYDIWQVANFFLREKTTDINKVFLNICFEQQDILPTASAAAGVAVDKGATSAVSKVPEPAAEKGADIQERVNVCGKLKALGYVSEYREATGQCVCRSAGPPLAGSIIDLKTTTMGRFLELCFALDLTASYPDVCARVGMEFVPDNTVGPPNKGICRKNAAVAGTSAKDCVIFFTQPKSEFVESCLELIPPPTVNAPPKSAQGGPSIVAPVPTP